MTTYNIRADLRGRKIQSLFTITSAHRDIWTKVFENPSLARVLHPDQGGAILINENEKLFVHLLILHLAASYRARKLGLYFQEEGLRRDIKEFFSLPLPKDIWKKSKAYQEHDFVDFVDATIHPQS